MISAVKDTSKQVAVQISFLDATQSVAAILVLVVCGLAAMITSTARRNNAWANRVGRSNNERRLVVCRFVHAEPSADRWPPSKTVAPGRGGDGGLFGWKPNM